ncbi:unnamed protein product, partial [Closterium sp. NIES-53]
CFAFLDWSCSPPLCLWGPLRMWDGSLARRRSIGKRWDPCNLQPVPPVPISRSPAASRGRARLCGVISTRRSWTGAWRTWWGAGMWRWSLVVGRSPWSWWATPMLMMQGTSRKKPALVARSSCSGLQPDSPLPAPSPYTEQTESFTEHREAESRPALPVHDVRTGCRVPRPRPPSVPGTHVMTLRPSSVPLRVPLPPPPESSLLAVPDPKSDLAHAANPVVSRLLATIVTDPSFESSAASALVAELVDFAAACRLDYATSLVAESESDCPPSVRGECALAMDVLEDRHEDFECFAAAVPHLVAMLLAPKGDPNAPDIPTPRSYAEAITGPYSSKWQTAMDAEMASWKSTGTYVDTVSPFGANIVDGMWIFRGVDFFHNFSPTPKMTTLWVLLHVAAQRDYELHSLDFSTTFLQGSVHEEI